MGGGIPSGSFLLLLGDVGSGHNEFAYTLAANLAYFKANDTFLHSNKTPFDEMSTLHQGEIKTPAPLDGDRKSVV